MKLLIPFVLMLSSLSALAESPIIADNNIRAIFSPYDQQSKRTLQRWFRNNNTVGEFGASDSCYIEGDSTPVFITKNAYAEDGIYALGIGGPNAINGFDVITRARAAKGNASIIILNTDRFENRIICQK